MASVSKKLSYIGPNCVVSSVVPVWDSAMLRGAAQGHKNLQVKNVLQHSALGLLIKDFINVYSYHVKKKILL